MSQDEDEAIAKEMKKISAEKEEARQFIRLLRQVTPLEKERIKGIMVGMKLSRDTH